MYNKRQHQFRHNTKEEQTREGREEKKVSHDLVGALMMMMNLRNALLNVINYAFLLDRLIIPIPNEMNVKRDWNLQPENISRRTKKTFAIVCVLARSSLLLFFAAQFLSWA